VQLTATPKAADGSVLSDRPVTWATSDPAIAAIGESGLVTGAAAGQATITATSEGKSGSTTVTVTAASVASVEVVPNPSSVLLGQTAQLTPLLRAENGDELSGRQVGWSSSDEAVATVSETGLVAGVVVGQATITATSEGQSGSTLLAAECALALGQPDEALALAREVRAIVTIDSLTEIRSAYVGAARLVEGRALLARGDTVEGQTAIARALTALRTGAGPEHPTAMAAEALAAHFES
jgi:uncharacterized protein YjdB